MHAGQLMRVWRREASAPITPEETRRASAVCDYLAARYSVLEEKIRRSFPPVPRKRIIMDEEDARAELQDEVDSLRRKCECPTCGKQSKTTRFKK